MNEYVIEMKISTEDKKYNTTMTFTTKEIRTLDRFGIDAFGVVFNKSIELIDEMKKSDNKS